MLAPKFTEPGPSRPPLDTRNVLVTSLISIFSTLSRQTLPLWAAESSGVSLSEITEVLRCREKVKAGNLINPLVFYSKNRQRDLNFYFNSHVSLSPCITLRIHVKHFSLKVTEMLVLLFLIVCFNSLSSMYSPVAL